MKQILKLIFVFLLMALAIPTSKLYASENSSVYSFQLTKHIFSDELTDPDDDKKGNRLPPHLINGYINNETGIHISGVDNSEILSYEVINEDGICLGEFYDEFEFVNFVFSLSQSIEIKIYTETYIYSGYIFIE